MQPGSICPVRLCQNSIDFADEGIGITCPHLNQFHQWLHVRSSKERAHRLVSIPDTCLPPTRAGWSSSREERWYVEVPASHVILNSMQDAKQGTWMQRPPWRRPAQVLHRRFCSKIGATGFPRSSLRSTLDARLRAIHARCVGRSDPSKGRTPLLSGARPDISGAKDIGAAIASETDRFYLDQEGIDRSSISERIEADDSIIGDWRDSLHAEPDPDPIVIGCPHLSEKELTLPPEPSKGEGRGARPGSYSSPLNSLGTNPPDPP